MADTDLNSEADPIAELLISYDELNSPHVDVLDEVPSALEFLRYVARNRPFVVRGGASDWKATRTWNVSTLKGLLKDEKVNVALTPKGHGDLVFVKPWEEEQSFDTFLDFVTRQELSSHDISDEPREDKEIRYAQTQNDNLRNEYLTLLADVEKEIPWARIALQQKPEAINLWIGNSRSITAMHKDNYENIYCQIIGQKHFVLLPPLAFPCINEQELQPAIYEKEGESLRMRIEDGEPKVPFAIWDPDRPTENTTEYSHLANPMRVTLEAGDMLYLPALW
ncbi:putative phospholipase a2 protein [Coleophoma crateriformis]|uniref:Putative phospholipase a2 protein n=1 Tax=Coleophoma crateriformis TaxID=565419 RepID=A0A3D8T8F1_9HELO|nr:putative phospholipase a2 protein [Coleophoma crateriformis]